MKISFITYERLNCNSVDELDLKESIKNCLRRNRIYYIGDLIDAIKWDRLNKIRGLGVKMEREIKNALFNYELCNSRDVISFITSCEKLA